jgi:heat shock protein HslJ
MDFPSIVGGAMALLMAAVATPEATPTAEELALPPIVWELAELTSSNGEAASVDPSELYTVQFLPEERVAVRADCNRGSGGFTREGSVLHFEPMATTMALCPEESLSQPFLMLFEGDVHFTYDEDGALTLDGDHGSAVLQPSLHGVVWEWQRFMGSDDSIREPDAPKNYTIEFLADGDFAIRADCNRGRGTYTVDRPQIDLTVGPTTRALCPPESQSNAFLKDIDAFSSFVFRDGNLYFALPVDAGISEFRATLLPAPSATAEAG